jgi:sugar O-acyltransferase (sialic acid O-acetyltransferase NeuD family)
MIDPRPLVIAGAGGFGLEVLWLVRVINASRRTSWNVLGFVDDDEGRRGAECEGLPMLGSTTSPTVTGRGPIYYHCAIGSNVARTSVADRLRGAGWLPATLIHPEARVAPDAIVGEGCFIAAGATVGPRARLGNNVIVNLDACVGHEATVASGAQLCPGARVLGRAAVGELGLVGTNATLNVGRRIGHQASVASNSFASEDVPDYTTCLGVPGRVVYRLPPGKRVPAGK